nr:hypothetical protein [Lapillicoccus sp.]
MKQAPVPRQGHQRQPPQAIGDVLRQLRESRPAGDIEEGHLGQVDDQSHSSLEPQLLGSTGEGSLGRHIQVSTNPRQHGAARIVGPHHREIHWCILSPSRAPTIT